MSKNVKQTPWHRVPSSDQYLIRDAEGGTVLSIRDGVIPTKSGGDLILAAPELLEACAAALEALDGREASAGCRLPVELDAPRASLRAAIHKAKGGAA